uniref:Uncharacterized protein n=1 Tax=Arundo donax TaxID=35708 RepID=A0A0A9FEG5_ARUDO
MLFKLIKSLRALSGTKIQNI